MDLRNLPSLHIFAVRSFIRHYGENPENLRDFSRVLSTIPKANQITKLLLDFTVTVHDGHPFDEEDWVGLCDEVVRVSAGKPLELNLKMSIHPPRILQYPSFRQDELYERIKEKIATLSDYPNICTHLWHPHSET